MWHDSDDRLSKAVERFEEGAVEAARIMLRNLDRRGVISPRIDLYLGHCHLEAEEYRAAIRRYRRCVALSPESPAPWLGLGLCYGRLGHIDRAIDAFRAALSRSPEMEEVHCNLTHCYALVGDLARAQEHAQKAVSLDPECPHVHRHLALAFLLAGLPERSLAAWRRVRALQPDHPELSVGVGRALARLERRGEARQCFLDGLAGPFAADAAYGLGELARDAGDTEEAARHFARAIEVDPGFWEARLRQAESLSDLGRYDEAWPVVQPPADREEDEDDEEDESGATAAIRARILRGLGRRREALRMLRTSVAQDPRDGDRWVVLGRHLLESARPRAAIAVLLRAQRTPGDHPEAARYLARALGRVGQGRRAVSVLARAAHRNPCEEELHMDTAAALLARGREAAAERALLRGLSWNPESALLWAAAAELALDARRMPLARARLRSALRRNRRHPHALSLLVRWLCETKRFRQAAAAGRAAMRVLPAGDAAMCAYGRALLACGRNQEALLQLRRYVLAAAGDPEGYAALAAALESIGDTRGAQTQRLLQEMVRAS
jgi:tetratricopeptide (TPR) repeat protein